MEEMTPQVFERVMKNPQQEWDSNSNLERYPRTHNTSILEPSTPEFVCQLSRDYDVCWGKQLEFPFQPYVSYFRSIPNSHGNLITLRTWTLCFHFLYPENFYVIVLSNSEILILL